jgi:hypothetical protein
MLPSGPVFASDQQSGIRGSRDFLDASFDRVGVADIDHAHAAF